jgi:predicted acetyltransferase
VPLLLHVDSHIVGFALLNHHNHTDRPLDHNMAEFFILRKHRRGGLGTAAAQAIFTRYPGVWEAAVARRNLGGLAFWHKAIGEHPLVQEVEEIDIATAAWNGPVMRFRIG